jgi:hypothetical protein
MPLASLLLATVLATQAPVKLAHTYVVDQSVTYSFDLNIHDEMSFVGDITFKTLDSKGNHQVSAPDIKVKMGGNEEKRDYKSDKVLLDSHGLAGSYEFNDTDIPFIVSTLCGYLPNKEVTKDAKFTFEDKFENYSLKGTGTLLELAEKDSKQTATIDYEIHVSPSAESEGILRIKSTFDVATGQLISCKGKVEIEGQESNVTVKRKA